MKPLVRNLAVDSLRRSDERPAICNDGCCDLSQDGTVLGSLYDRW